MFAVEEADALGDLVNGRFVAHRLRVEFRNRRLKIAAYIFVAYFTSEFVESAARRLDRFLTEFVGEIVTLRQSLPGHAKNPTVRGQGRYGRARFQTNCRGHSDLHRYDEAA